MPNKLEEMRKVFNGEKYTKRWDFWAPLARADLVTIHSKSPPKYGISFVQLTETGIILLKIKEKKE